MEPSNLDIDKLLGRIFEDFQKVKDPEEHARRKQDFVFHMMDWKADLERISELYKNPDESNAEAGKIVVAFLYHTIPHLNAAGRLLLDRIPDPFSTSER